MLWTLKAKPNSLNPDKIALHLYPELLRDGYNREQLKDIKKRMLFDAKSGAIRCKNKRLYVLPDWYAVCEYLFLGIKQPKGLLANGEIACKPYLEYDKADVLRSPSLYMEHAVRTIVKNPEIYEWLCSDGIYTSVHDLISRILQFDVDGDQLNVIVDPLIVKIAERNIKKYDIIPLYYDAAKADPEAITKESIFNGLKRAHQFSNIGEISNMLTRLWNRDNPDRTVAAMLTALNNWRIDGAKTGAVNEYTKYPDIEKRVNKAVGGPNGRLPDFFQFSKNGRRDKTTNRKHKRQWAKPNDSTMNRICRAFDDIGNINMNWAEVQPFNWKMLMPGPCVDNREDIANTFCDLDNIKTSIVVNAAEENPNERDDIGRKGILEEYIVYVLIKRYKSLENCYPYITKHLFTGDNTDKSIHKQTYWRIFGDIAVEVLKKNLAASHRCDKCKALVPDWDDKHICITSGKGFSECIDCHELFQRNNAKQKRCKVCQDLHRRDSLNEAQKKLRKRRSEENCFTSWLLHYKKM